MKVLRRQSAIAWRDCTVTEPVCGTASKRTAKRTEGPAPRLQMWPAWGGVWEDERQTTNGVCQRRGTMFKVTCSPGGPVFIFVEAAIVLAVSASTGDLSSTWPMSFPACQI